ncbi:MAG: hypothetical protein ACQEXJ_21225 [Myxococcota bacterium]
MERRNGVGTMAGWFAVVAMAWLLPACIDGGRVDSALPPGFLADVPPTEDADAGDGAADADVEDADVADAPEDADVEVGPDADADAADVELPPQCEVDADCLPFDDGNLCNGRWTCQDGTCVEEAPVECEQDEVGACREVACDPPTGECVTVAVPDGTACSDQDPCTPDDRCEAGECRSGERMSCDDGNPCTEDACVSGACRHSNASLGTSCDDGNPCTVGDTCNLGRCTGQDNLCECQVDEDCAEYEDGDACNGVVKCVGGECKAGLSDIPVCHEMVDPGPCELPTCDPETGDCGVVPAPDGTGCDDGDPCTVGDTCQGGTCTGGPPRTCDGGPCADAACDAETGVCEATAAEDGTSCEGEGCLAGATCRDGACIPAADVCACEEDADCGQFGDGDLCDGTLSCVLGRCVNDPSTLPECPPITDPQCQETACDPATGDCTLEDLSDGTPCDDGDACTEDDACVGGVCEGTSTVCEATGPCTEAACDPVLGCRVRDVGVACESGDLCAEASGCSGGECVAVAEKSCPGGGTCLDAACNPATGGCEFMAVTGDCDDGDPCTAEDACLGGECLGAPVSCDDDEPCTADACLEDGTCEHTPIDGLVCDDGNACTTGDVCQSGACSGSLAGDCECDVAADCEVYDDGNPCNGTLTCDAGDCVMDPATVITCDEEASSPCLATRCDPEQGECVEVPRADGLACRDTDPCILGGACQAGVCVGLPRSCDDGNPCTTDSCDPELGCVHEAMSGDACDDGNPCTTGTACTDGQCVGGENTCGCTEDADCVDAEDGNACNGTLVCVDEACVVDPATVVTCEQSADPCVENVCDQETGACEPTPVADAACEDGNPCTVGDTCVDGVCEPGEPRACTAGGQCAEGSCDPATGECLYTAVEGACDDGNPCTTGDSCEGGTCGGDTNLCPCTVDEDCDSQIANKCLGTPACGVSGCEVIEDTAVECGQPDDTACAFHECDPATGDCVETVLDEGEPCEDGDPCTVSTTCDASGQCVGEPLDCDDGNPCTADTCEPDEGCVHTPLEDDTTCEDDDPCTQTSACEAGECVATSIAPECFCGGGGTCPTVDDPCDGTYECVSGICRLSDPVECSPTGREPCLTNTCDPATGSCETQQPAGGTACDDGDPCTDNDRCAAGSCIGDKVSCDDGNSCTEDTCVDGSCIHGIVDGGSCDDGDPCTRLEECVEGVCTGGTDVCDCNDDSDCTFLDDGDQCNGVAGCVDGRCQERIEGSEVTCFDPDPYDCREVACNPDTGACEETVRPDGAACTDGSVCTSPDQCSEGECVGVPTVTCDDPNPSDCVDIACHPDLGVCTPMERPDGTSCDDGNACTEGDVCVSGGCQGTLIDCDDGEPCTEDICSASLGCVHRRLFGPCDDGDPCTDGTRCNAGVCTGGSDACPCDSFSDCQHLNDGDACTGLWQCASGNCTLDTSNIPDCPPSDNPCVAVSCTEGACQETLLDGTWCDDGDPCTVDDQCVEGVCEGEATACDDGNPCTLDTCSSATGACTYEPAASGTACEDGDPCTAGDTCRGGECVPGDDQGCACDEDADCAAFEDGNLCNGTLVCDGGTCRVNPATVVACPVDPTGCVPEVCDPETGQCVADPAPEGAPCNDGDPCTVDDRCSGGVCAGTLMDCTDDNPCTEDVCDSALGCLHLDAAGPCDDGDPCTVGDVCVDGECVGEPNTCDDGNPCTADSCLSSTIGCRNLNEANTLECDDGNACTTGDRCTDGVCTGQNTCDCESDADCETADLCNGEMECVDGFCEVVPGSSPDCPDDTACATWACSSSTGECVMTPINEGGECDDGSLCTEGDSCVEGSCVGTPIDCADEGGPCVDQVCHPASGCQPVDASAACDDSDPCTVDDHCVEGTCRGLPAVAPTETFDDGDLTAWTLDSASEVAGWQLTAARAASEPLSMVALNPETGSLGDPAGPWSATATRAAVSIPEGSLAAEVRFHADLDVTGDACLQVLVDDALVHEQCDATDGFVPSASGAVDLTAFAGQAVEVAFVVDVATAETGGAGIFLDDVAFDWSCPVK